MKRFFHDGTEYQMRGDETIAMSHFHELRTHLHQLKRINVNNLPQVKGTKFFSDGSVADFSIVYGLEKVNITSPVVEGIKEPPVEKAQHGRIVCCLRAVGDEWFVACLGKGFDGPYYAFKKTTDIDISEFEDENEEATEGRLISTGEYPLDGFERPMLLFIPQTGRVPDGEGEYAIGETTTTGNSRTFSKSGQYDVTCGEPPPRTVYQYEGNSTDSTVQQILLFGTPSPVPYRQYSKTQHWTKESLGADEDSEWFWNGSTTYNTLKDDLTTIEVNTALSASYIRAEDSSKFCMVYGNQATVNIYTFTGEFLPCVPDYGATSISSIITPTPLNITFSVDGSAETVLAAVEDASHFKGGGGMKYYNTDSPAAITALLGYRIDDGPFNFVYYGPAADNSFHTTTFELPETEANYFEMENVVGLPDFDEYWGGPLRFQGKMCLTMIIAGDK